MFCRILLSSLLLTTALHAQVIDFPLDTNMVSVDGVLATDEWKNAASLMIGVNATDSVRVLYKHDNTAMYFAFSGKLESANALFPELLMDAQNKNGSSWSAGQWWFHVSATDCENDGAYGKYDNCLAIQPDWEGAPNFSPGSPMTDTVEIRIPFSKVGFNTATMDTMGMVMMVSNTATTFKTYPAGADKEVPATWAKAVFRKYYATIAEHLTLNTLGVYPNPATDILNITGTAKGDIITITDISGRQLFTVTAANENLSIGLADYISGTYLLSVLKSSGPTQSQIFTKQ